MLLLALSVSLYLFSQTSGTCGQNLSWSFDRNTGQLTITGTGDMTNWNNSSSVPWNSFNYSIQTVSLPNGMTSIGKYAFSSCNRISAIAIPNSVTSIGESAFSYCSGLTSVTIGNSVISIGVGAFYLCTNLISVTIPNSVTSIEDYAFEHCINLTSVTIPNSVTSIGERAFKGCSGLTSPLYNSHIFAYMPTTYSGTYDIPDGIESIAGEAFSYCNGLTSVTISNSVIKIEEGAFEYCTGLDSVTIGNSVTSIGHAVFYGCSSLTSIAIPNSVTSIGSMVFTGCSRLTTIDVSINNQNYCSIDGVLFSKDIKNLIRWPSGKQGVYSIPNSVTSIGNGGFYCCDRLTSVTIPSSVTSIGNSAFIGCSGLTTIVCNAMNPPSLGSNVFGDVDKSIPLYVPAESVVRYVSADQWRNFIHILAIPDLDSMPITSADSENSVQKLIINGLFYILLPDGTRYDATGKMVQ